MTSPSPLKDLDNNKGQSKLKRRKSHIGMTARNLEIKQKKIKMYQIISKTFLSDKSIYYGKPSKKQKKVQYFLIDNSSLQLETKMIQLHYNLPIDV